MAQYAFLSDEWVDEARKIRQEYEGRAAAMTHQMRMNLVVTDVPFGDGPIDAHLDTTDGPLKLDKGHIDPADLKVTLEYATAKAILVEGGACSPKYSAIRPPAKPVAPRRVMSKSRELPAMIHDAIEPPAGVLVPPGSCTR